MLTGPLRGKVWKFGEEIDTGQIMPGRYVPLTDPQELAGHVFEDVAPEFAKGVRQGDIIVAGRNFGCGSSREHAPKGIRGVGVAAVVADSFARIFFRNALNLGLPAIPIPGISKAVNAGDTLEIDLVRGVVKNIVSGEPFSFPPYDAFIMDMIREGGIINYTFKKLLDRR